MIIRRKVDFIHFFSSYQLLKTLFSSYGDKIIVAYLFGSVAQKKYGPLSDIDIAVLFNKNINLPETYADIFRILSEINVIDKDFAKNLSNMAKFRNRLVHMYWEIDDRLIYDIVKNNLVELKKFIEIVINYIDTKNS